MTLDIMVPFWGDPALLHATIDTVRTQTDPDWQLTVVDDCYPDPEVAASFARETDPRIRYLRNEHNLGITANYERCRDLAEHDLMVFLGCDDLLLPTYVDTVRAAHERFPGAAIIQPGVQVVDGDGTVVSPLGDRVKAFLRPGATTATVLSGEALATSLLRGNWMYWPSLAFRTDVLRRHDFREGLPIVQDLALVVDMVAAGESMVVDPTVCFAYRRHEASASSTTLVSGDRLGDDRRYYRSAAEQMAARGWKRAARAARLRATSRLHAVSLMPGAARARDAASFRALVRHAAGA